MPEIDTNLRSKFPHLFEKWNDSIFENQGLRGDTCLVVAPSINREVIQTLKEKYEFNMLMDIVGIDYLKFVPEHRERFAVVYILYSMARHEHIQIKCYIPEEAPKIRSTHDLYKAVNWFEREIWDLYGVEFEGHPNLIRILCHQDFVGHPLRKDYPADQYQRLKIAATSTGI